MYGAIRLSKYLDARIIFKDFETSNWTWDPVAKAYYWHRFYSHQPDLNFDNPHVREAMLDVIDFWFDMGVDGFRLDAVPYLVRARRNQLRESAGDACVPAASCARTWIRSIKDRMLLAEANQWPEDAVAYFGGRRRMPDGVSFPADAAAVHGHAHGGPFSDHRDSAAKRRLFQRIANGRCSCAITMS